MKLFDYFRSSASYRVRIALNLKGIAYDSATIHLVNEGGQQHKPSYKALNPQGLVPTLEVENQYLTQSLAIIEYLEERYPTPPLLPSNAIERAQVRALALIVACDIHPLNNLRVLQTLKKEFDANKSQVDKWYASWIQKGFDAYEKQITTLKRDKPVSLGSHFSLADICLIPQVYNANRFDVDLSPYPCIQEINDYCLRHDAFIKASPEALEA